MHVVVQGCLSRKLVERTRAWTILFLFEINCALGRVWTDNFSQNLYFSVEKLDMYGDNIYVFMVVYATRK